MERRHDGRRPARARGTRPPAVPAAIAVLGGARGTNEDAFAWAVLADALGIAHRDAQLGDGLPAVACSALPRATIDETATAATIVLLGARPQGGAAGPVPAPAPCRRAAHGQDHRDRARQPPGSPRHAWRSIRVEAGRSRRRSPPPSPITTIVDQLARRSRRRRRRAGQPRRVDRRRRPPRCRPCSTPVPGAKVLPALRRGNVVGALQLGLTPSAGGLDATGILTAAADGRIDLLVLLGADPLDDFPDADLARRALAGARRDHRDRHVPDRRPRRPPTSCSPPPPTARSPARRRTSRAASRPSARR